MSYLVLARKYRPLDFSTVRGQEHVTRTLANAIKRDIVSHAYLLAGPRGVGKTSIARIFSKSLNCKKGPTPKPCLKCTNCLEITQGISMAVREIDGASHNSVDNVRELIDSFRSLPPPGSLYKVYIIDEVHMLSSAAFNALLKSLEEPPPHTVFILATTESHKIPETVISRCQRHDLRALGRDDIEACLRNITTEEKIQIEDEALRMIVRLSDGSMRDAQSILERLRAYCDEGITAADTGRILGSVERRIFFRLSEAVFSHQSQTVLDVLTDAFSGGLDMTLFLKEFVFHWRALMIARFGGEGALTRLGLSEADISEMQTQAAPVSQHDIQDLVKLAREGADAALRSAYPRAAVEALLVRMALRQDVLEMSTLLDNLRQASRSAGTGGGGGGQRPASAVSQAQPKAAPVAPASVASRDDGQAPVERPEAAQNLDWAGFVRAMSTGGQRMMAEQLKQLSITKIEAGTLEACGPELAIKYFMQEGNRDKLRDALAAHMGGGKWSVLLSRADSGGKAAPGSVAYAEEKRKNEKHKEGQEQIVSHPKLQSLQKVFPGSKIEGISAKN